MLFSNKIWMYVLLIFSVVDLTAQNQKLSDSLLQIYNTSSYTSLEAELQVIQEISRTSPDPNRRLKYAQMLIDKASVDSLIKFMFSGYQEKGNALKDRGDYTDALSAFFKSLSFSEIMMDTVWQGRTKISIADTYSEIGNDENALKYYEEGIQILRSKGDERGLGIALFNAGDRAVNLGELEKALLYFNEANTYFEAQNFLLGKAYNMGNIGRIYAKKKQFGKAIEFLEQAIPVLEEIEDNYGAAFYLNSLAEIHLEQKQLQRAEILANKSLNYAKRDGLKQQIRDANFILYEINEHEGNHKVSLDYYKEYVLFRDSIINLKTVQDMANMRTEHEVAQKQNEVDLLQKDTEILALKDERSQQVILGTGVALVLILLLAIGLFNRYKYIRKTNAIIEEEKQKSDALLLNILPDETAKELKEKGKVKAKRFDSVSVLFTDFKGFTHFAENLDPEILVESVDYYFSRFDKIIEKFGLEKIKTVGDAYMCAGGLPFPSENHAKKMVAAALEIVEEVKRIKADPAHEYNIFDIRIGINTGPVVAGVVGTKKFVYDIWGDAVNIAARMESNSEPGYVNVSENTYELIKEDFDCEFRGLINAKNRGELKMYFVSGPKKGQLKYA